VLVLASHLRDWSSSWIRTRSHKNPLEYNYLPLSAPDKGLQPMASVLASNFHGKAEMATENIRGAAGKKGRVLSTCRGQDAPTQISRQHRVRARASPFCIKVQRQPSLAMLVPAAFLKRLGRTMRSFLPESQCWNGLSSGLVQLLKEQVG
jgi:hypothetical protein